MDVAFGLSGPPVGEDPIQGDGDDIPTVPYRMRVIAWWTRAFGIRTRTFVGARRRRELGARYDTAAQCTDTVDVGHGDSRRASGAGTSILATVSSTSAPAPAGDATAGALTSVDDSPAAPARASNARLAQIDCGHHRRRRIRSRRQERPACAARFHRRQVTGSRRPTHHSGTRLLTGSITNTPASELKKRQPCTQ